MADSKDSGTQAYAIVAQWKILLAHANQDFISLQNNYSSMTSQH